jgi:hypothetical protein
MPIRSVKDGVFGHTHIKKPEKKMAFKIRWGILGCGGTLNFKLRG